MDDNKVEITKVLNAPIEKVWDAWTNPESIKQWLSPEGMTNPEVSNDFNIGGTYRIIMEGHNMPDPNHNGIMAVGGEYLEIEKPHKLVYTWLWENAPAETHTTKITILFKKLKAMQTEMILIHSGFADDAMRHEHAIGWSSTFEKLDLFLRGGEEK